MASNKSKPARETAMERAAAAALDIAIAGGDPESPEPARMPDDVHTPVSLDLDTLSKFDVLEDAVEEPFTIRLKSKVFTMIDPRDIDWKDIFQSLRNPVMFMRYAMPEDQQDVFYSLGMPAWQLGVIMERWHKHYKMADPSDLAKLITG